MQRLRLMSRLDSKNSRLLRDQLIELLDQGEYQVELDFSETEQVDSSGLGKLLLFDEKFKEKGGKLKLVNVKRLEVVDLFQLIKLERVLSVEYGA